MECIVEEYIKFTNNFFTNYYKTLLDNNYDKNIVEPFISQYINVRYYNYTVYNSEKNFVEKINKELHNIAKLLISENPNEELVKNTYALFTYLLYLDDCYEYKSTNALIKNLFEDKNIKLTYTEAIKTKFKELVNNYINQKKQFTDTFNIKDFVIRETKISNNIYDTTLDYTFEVNKLYSEYAINTAYNSDVVLENRLYLLIMMLSKKIIDLTLKMNYSTKYIVDMPLSLFQKPKKQKRFLRALDNDILKNRISIKIKYKDYMANKEQINNLISSGYNFTLELDNTFIDDINCLVLFINVIVYKKENYYDAISSTKDSINTNLIIL